MIFGRVPGGVNDHFLFCFVTPPPTQKKTFHFHPTLYTLAANTNAVPAIQKTPEKTFTPVHPPFSFSRIAPAIGDVVKAPILLTKNTIPVLKPISFIGETCATSPAIKETYAPEKNPYRTAYAICAPSFRPDGSHRARVVIPVARAATVKTLYFPILSARKPVRRRPKRLFDQISRYSYACLRMEYIIE